MATFIGAYSGRSTSYEMHLDVWEAAVYGGTSNYSTIGWQLSAVGINGASGTYNLSGGTATVVVAGQTVYSANHVLDFRNKPAGTYIVIASGSINVGHDNNGNGSVSASASDSPGTPFGTANASGSIGMTHVDIPPGAPVYVNNSATASSIHLEWTWGDTHGLPIDLNNLRIWTAGYSWDNPNIYNGNVAAWSADIGGLAHTTTYYWGVSSHSAGGWGPPSNTGGSWYIATLSAVPGPASGYSAQQITSTSAKTANVGLADNGGAAVNNLRAKVNTSQSDTGATVFTAGAVADVPMTGLTRATQYYFACAYANANGWGAYGPWVGFKTLAELPVMGTSYSATSLTRNSAVITGLSVTDNGGETPSNARVQYNTSATDVGASVVTQGSWNNVTIPGLAALTTYYYRVAAYNSAGWSAYPTTWKSFTTLSDAPSDMAAPTFSAITDTTMRANWVAPNMNGATFTNYRYEVCLDNNFAVLVTSGTTTNLYVDLTGLIPGTTYFVRVRANATPNNGGYGLASQKTTGIAPQSGMRGYAVIGGVVKQGDLYYCHGGVISKLKPMTVIGGTVQTE